MAEDAAEGDDLFGWLRIVVTVLGVSLLPVWVVATAVIAETWFDGTLVLTDESGELRQVEFTAAARLLISAFVAAAGMLVVGGVAAIVAALVALWRSRRGREEVRPVELAGGHRVRVKVKEGGVRPVEAPPAPTPPAPAPAPPAEVRVDEPPPEPPLDPPHDPGDDEIERLLRRS